MNRLLTLDEECALREKWAKLNPDTRPSWRDYWLKAQQALTRQEIPEAVKAERDRIADWLTRKVYSDGLLLPHSIIEALKGEDK